MGYIDQNIIDEILRKTDIVDVIGEQVALSKKGKSYFGLCPFHSEKTPSFSVEPNKKIYNCFSCGAKGNAITFLQQSKQLSFLDSVKELADRANVELDLSNVKVNPNQALYDMNKEAMQFYHFYLNNTVSGEAAKRYLKDRGLDQDVIDTFDLGLAPNDFNVLTKTLTNKGYVESDMVDLGLTKQSEKGSFYDLFRDRIIFPILDQRHNVLAFSGRLFKQADASQPKYINSPQTAIFTKSSVLYNLNNALETIKQSKRIVLLEGYMDVIACYRAGILDAVASMGTSLTQQQVSQIKSLAQEVVICYDGDTAGIEATKRALNMFLKAQLNVKIVQLPKGLDPDDYINKYSTDALKEHINHNWIDTYEFFYNTTKESVDFNKMLEIEKFKKDIFTHIKNAPNTVVDLYLNKLSIDSRLNIKSIQQDFTQFSSRRLESVNRVSKIPVNIELKYSKAERLILNYFVTDLKYWIHFRNEILNKKNKDGQKDQTSKNDDEQLFFIDRVNRDIRFSIEDIYYDRQKNGDTDSPVTDEELVRYLTPEQYDLYHNKIRYNKEEMSYEEFMDFIQVFKEYQFKMKIKEINQKIRAASSIEEKVKLAKERDKLKEEFYGQR